MVCDVLGREGALRGLVESGRLGAFAQCFQHIRDNYKKYGKPCGKLCEHVRRLLDEVKTIPFLPVGNPGGLRRVDQLYDQRDETLREFLDADDFVPRDYEDPQWLNFFRKELGLNFKLSTNKILEEARKIENHLQQREQAVLEHEFVEKVLADGKAKLLLEFVISQLLSRKKSSSTGGDFNYTDEQFLEQLKNVRFVPGVEKSFASLLSPTKVLSKMQDLIWDDEKWDCVFTEKKSTAISCKEYTKEQISEAVVGKLGFLEIFSVDVVNHLHTFMTDWNENILKRPNGKVLFAERKRILLEILSHLDRQIGTMSGEDATDVIADLGPGISAGEKLVVVAQHVFGRLWHATLEQRRAVFHANRLALLQLG